MATGRAIKPAWSEKTQTRCDTAVELLRGRDYQKAAEILRDAKIACPRLDTPIAAHVLNAAYRICLACKQAQEEADWHGRVYAATLEREQELKQELQSILDLISNPEGVLPTAAVGESNAGDAGATASVRHISSLAEHHGLWDRIQSLIHGVSFRHREMAAELMPAVHAAKSVESEWAIAEPCRHDDGAAPAPNAMSTPREAAPALAVCCLGAFQVYVNDRLVANWRNGKAKSVFKYLVAHHERAVPKEILMDVFWPEANPNHARNSLNVAIYHIRQTLSVQPDFSHLLFQNNCYLLNPELDVWIDAESFSEHLALARAMEEHGNQEAAIREYCAAEAAYGGQFLEEDRYEEWIEPRRQALEDDYLKLLNRLSQYYFEMGEYDKCVAACNKLLAVDTCQEEAHRQLMRCYCRKSQPNLAVRQFHNCVKALDRELGVLPSAQTVELDERIRDHGQV